MPICGRASLQLVHFGTKYFLQNLQNRPSGSKMKWYMLYHIGHATLTYYYVEQSLALGKKNENRHDSDMLLL